MNSNRSFCGFTIYKRQFSFLPIPQNEELTRPRSAVMAVQTGIQVGSSPPSPQTVWWPRGELFACKENWISGKIGYWAKCVNVRASVWDEAGSGCSDFNLSRGFIPLLSLMSGESLMMLANEVQWTTRPRQVSRKGWQNVKSENLKCIWWSFLLCSYKLHVFC